MDWKFNEQKNRVVLDAPPKQRLKLTATRLGSVLNMNPYATPFEAWCEIVKLYKKPFEGNKYTKAGQAIEPIIIQWCKENLSDKVVSPEEYYGNNYAELKYDFYKNRERVFGGMWDCAIPSGADLNKLLGIIEIKTSGNPQDWVDGVPMEKLLQGLQYGKLEKAKYTYVVVAFLKDEDYAHPEKFVPVLGKNLKLFTFLTEDAIVVVEREETHIAEALAYAEEWWKAFVETGVSPEFDEKRDADILRELRTQRPDETDTSVAGVIRGIATLESEIEAIRTSTKLDVLEDNLKKSKEALKRMLSDLMKDDDEKIQVGKWILSRQGKTSVDTDALKKAGLYDTYTKTSVTLTLRQTTGEEKE